MIEVRRYYPRNYDVAAVFAIWDGNRWVYSVFDENLVMLDDPPFDFGYEHDTDRDALKATLERVYPNAAVGVLAYVDINAEELLRSQDN